MVGSTRYLLSSGQIVALCGDMGAGTRGSIVGVATIE